MPIVDTATLPVHGEIPHQQSVYCGLDCCITMEVIEGLLSLGPPPPLYTFLRDLQAPFLEMQLRGFRVDHGEMLRVLGRLNERVGALREWLNELGGSLDMPELNPRSQPQKQEMVRRLFLPERWVSVKGVRKFPMDRDALEWYDSMYIYARPFCRAIQACQDTYSDIKTLETEVRRGRWHTSWNLTGTDTGRLSSSAAWDGTGCVLPTAEALTRKGWKQIDQVMDGEEIAQYDEGVIEFVPCRVFRKRYSGDVLTVQSEQLKLTVTPEHRILHFGPQNDSIFVERADIVRNRSQEAIPLGGKLYQGGEKYPSYLSMLMADFSKEGSGWRGQLKKQRKIDRFLALALAFDIPYTEQKAPEGYRRFYIPGHLAWPKKWGSWVLDLDYSSACALIDEARYWDGHDRGSGFWFFTADREQAEWFATLVHLVGRGATIRHAVSPEGSFNPGGIMWTVNVKTRGHAQIKRKHWGRDIYNGYVYCPSVPSSFWLVRQDGFISVTGNSNLQNITRDGAGENASPDDLHLRRMFIADDDRVLVSMDRKQSEAREVGYLLGLLFDDWKYLDLLETTDIHTYVAREVWQDLPWTGDIKRDRAIAERPYYRNNSYRDMAKKLAHGSSYCGSAHTMAHHAHCSVSFVERFQERFLDHIFPAFRKWHRWTAERLQLDGELENLFGDKRQFFDDPLAPETLRKAVAYIPQSSTARRTNMGVLALWQSGLPIELLAQGHDSITYQCRQEDLAEVIPQALALTEVTLIAPNGRKFVVPGDCKVGWNWGNWAKDNPNGLKEWKGEESRVRLAQRMPSVAEMLEGARL